MNGNCTLDISIASVLDFLSVISELQVCRRKLFLGDTSGGDKWLTTGSRGKKALLCCNVSFHGTNIATIADFTNQLDAVLGRNVQNQLLCADDSKFHVHGDEVS